MDQAWEGEEVGCRQASGTVRGQIPETGSGLLETALLSVSPRPSRSESTESPETAPAGAPPGEQLDVVPTQGDLLGDLLNLDLGPPVSGPPLATSAVQMGAVDLLGGGLDSLVRPRRLDVVKGALQAGIKNTFSVRRHPRIM